jgi:hypothetical protein
MKAELKSRIEAALHRNPTHKNSQITKNLNGICSAADVEMIRNSMTKKDAEPPTEPMSKGVSLTTKRVLSRRPAESAAKFIRRLPKGRGFDLKALSHEWGMSEETIRKHARDMGCMKFVEVSEDEWVPMIMHPDTAAQYAV